MSKFLYRFNSVLYVLLLSGMGTLFWIMPKKAKSEFEKRDLCKLPEFSLDKLKSGRYVDSLDLYYSDNFPFRDEFVELAFFVKKYRGIESENIAFYNESIDFDAGTETLNNSETVDSTLKDSTETISEEDKITFHNDGKAQDVKSLMRGLLIYNGMAIQMFGGSRGTAIYLSRTMNELKRQLPDHVNVYLGVTPTHGEFYLPTEYIDKKVSERKIIDTIYKYLDSTVISFDVTAELFKHKNEYIFFNTDHHWTGTGAYYAYTAFCKSAGFEAIPLTDMKRGVIPNFLGTLYRMTRDKRLAENKDSVVYHKIPISHQAYRLFGNGYGLIRKTNLYVEAAKGGNAYGVYLGGDVPALCVASKLQNGRRVLILKNSYGNAISHYFVSHFERTYIADYRYFDCNLKDFIEKNGITDLIVFHNSFSANTPSHVDMLKDIAGNKTVCVAHSLPNWDKMFPEGQLLYDVYKEHQRLLSNEESNKNEEKNNIIVKKTIQIEEKKIDTLLKQPNLEHIENDSIQISE